MTLFGVNLDLSVTLDVWSQLRGEHTKWGLGATAIATICWNLWRERNDRIFRDLAHSTIVLYFKLILTSPFGQVSSQIERGCASRRRTIIFRRIARYKRTMTLAACDIRFEARHGQSSPSFCLFHLVFN